MAERDVEPTPGNFELFFAYVAGENAAVVRVPGDPITAGAEITPEVLEDLRKHLFSEAGLEGALDATGDELTKTMNTVSARLEIAGAIRSPMAARYPRRAANSAAANRPMSCANWWMA